MSIKLDFALCENNIVNINRKLSTTKQYFCPFCKDEVIPRKGPIRVHHFAHKPNSNCTASEETLLHFNAKYYILMDQGIEFEVPLKYFKKIGSILTPLGISNLPIKLNDMCNYYYLSFFEGDVEQKVGPFIADVLFPDAYGHEWQLVIEICVSHPLEDEKRNYFKEQHIPYIELVPQQSGNKITFTVNDLSMPDFLKEYEEKIVQEMMHRTYNHFHHDLINEAKKEVYNFEQVTLNKEKAYEIILDEIEQINFREFISAERYKEMMSIPIVPNHMPSELDMRELQSVSLKGKTLRVNGNYFVNRESEILYYLLKYFKDEGIRIEAVIETDPLNHKKSVVGFNFLLCSTFITGDQLKSILKTVVKKLEKDDMLFP